jgi:prolyl oligopeptidase
MNTAFRLFIVFSFVARAAANSAMAQLPPVAPTETVVDTYFGIEIADPYRYMERFDDPRVQAWVKGQAEHADTVLASLPGRAALLQRIAELDAGAPYTVFGITRRANDDLFYFKQLADEDVAKVYLREAATVRERLLIDPETFPKSDPNDHFTISFYRVSPDASQLLYGFAASGSEQTTLRIFDLATNADLPDVIDRLEAEYALPTWLPDGKSFTYSRRRKLPTDAPPADGYKFTQAFHHCVGDDPSNDTLLFADGAAGSPGMGAMDFPAVVVTPGSPWAVGQIKHGDETDVTLYVAPLAEIGAASCSWTKLCDRGDLVTDFAVHGDDVYLLTAYEAPRFKVVRISPAKPDFHSAETIVPASTRVIDSLDAASDALYVGCLEGVPRRVLRIPYDADVRDEPPPLVLPDGEPSGGVEAVSPELPGALVRTRSWTRAGRLYHYDPAAGAFRDTGILPRGKFDSPAGITSQEVMVAGHDGVRVPLSIVYSKKLQLDGSNPTLLTGYGAYGHTTPMSYDPTNLAWLERGGVLAFAHVRGGGAFGKEWHHAGRKATKPNTWKDFIACAEYLVRTGYTGPERLAGRGGSAGGILIGRAITERPELFAAANIAVGCTDMLRFETTMNGPPNIPEFGTVTDEESFRGLLAMSTLHHIQDGTKYPAIILTHGINDPRVEPWESAKATARFQAATGSRRPILFRVDYHAGHGIGSTRTQRHAEKADIWSFFLWQFGNPEFQPKSSD